MQVECADHPFIFLLHVFILYANPYASCMCADPWFIFFCFGLYWSLLSFGVGREKDIGACWNNYGICDTCIWCVLVVQKR